MTKVNEDKLIFGLKLISEFAKNKTNKDYKECMNPANEFSIDDLSKNKLDMFDKYIVVGRVDSDMMFLTYINSILEMCGVSTEDEDEDEE
jgi:hypothetical protein